MKHLFQFVAAAVLSAAVAAPAQAEDTIKIGVPGAHTGDLATYGVPSLNAAKIVVAKVNANGGVLGKKIELIAEDDQCKPELATNAATKLLSDKERRQDRPLRGHHPRCRGLQRHCPQDQALQGRCHRVRRLPAHRFQAAPAAAPRPREDARGRP